MADTETIKQAILSADTSEKAEVVAKEIADVHDRAVSAEARNAVVEKDLQIAEQAQQDKLDLKLPEGVELESVQVALRMRTAEGNGVVMRGAAKTFDLALAKAIGRMNDFGG